MNIICIDESNRFIRPMQNGVILPRYLSHPDSTRVISCRLNALRVSL